MAGKYQDGVYARKPWVAPTESSYPPQAYIGPFASNMERLVSQSLASYTMTSEELQQHVRPNLPQIELFPDRYGFVEEELGIEDIIELSGRPRQRHDFSGEPTTQESTSRNTLGKGV